MDDKSTKRYMELQMEELKAFHGDKVEKEKPVADNGKDESKAEIAQMYEDAWEYETSLAMFERELEIIKANELANIVAELTKRAADKDRDYGRELKVIMEAGWTHFVEAVNSHPQEQLDIIKTAEFGEMAEKLQKAFPDSGNDFASEIRDLLIKNWETKIAIMKEHIKEEHKDIKIAGLKPHFAKRIYKEYHGLA